MSHQHRPSNKHAIETGIWVFLLFDLSIFALYFWIFAWDKTQLPEQFAAGQATLNTAYGAFNTLALLISSYFIANAVQKARLNDVTAVKRNLILTILCGITFLVVKCVEYADKFKAGHYIDSNVFYRDYFAFTGFHMLHVFIGLILLGYILFESQRTDYLKDNTNFLVGSSLYWHMVDLVWVVLFSLIYLVV